MTIGAEGCHKPLGKMGGHDFDRDKPPSPDHVSFGDLVDELHFRVTVVRQ